MIIRHSTIVVDSKTGKRLHVIDRELESRDSILIVTNGRYLWKYRVWQTVNLHDSHTGCIHTQITVSEFSEAYYRNLRIR